MRKTTNKVSPEMRRWAVRLVLDNQGQHRSRWQAVLSISSKIGCVPQTLNDWVNWFNNSRILKQIANIPPAEAEANFYTALKTEPRAA
jgi:transposase-like protein